MKQLGLISGIFCLVLSSNITITQAATVNAGAVTTPHLIVETETAVFTWENTALYSADGYIYQSSPYYESYAIEGAVWPSNFSHNAGGVCCGFEGPYSSVIFGHSPGDAEIPSLTVLADAQSYGNAFSHARIERGFSVSGNGVVTLSFATAANATIVGDVLGAERVYLHTSVSSDSGQTSSIQYDHTGSIFFRGDTSPDSTWDFLTLEIQVNGPAQSKIVMETFALADTGIPQVPTPGAFWLFCTSIAAISLRKKNFRLNFLKYFLK